MVGTVYSLLTYPACLDTLVAFSKLPMILDDRNYNVNYHPTFYQNCSDISEALINQICSNISEAFSNNRLRVNKLLANLCSQLFKVFKLSVNLFVHDFWDWICLYGDLFVVIIFVHTADVVQMDIILSCGFNVYESNRCLLNDCYSCSM
jgi:hypothetical protein